MYNPIKTCFKKIVAFSLYTGILGPDVALKREGAKLFDSSPKRHSFAGLFLSGALALASIKMPILFSISGILWNIALVYTAFCCFRLLKPRGIQLLGVMRLFATRTYDPFFKGLHCFAANQKSLIKLKDFDLRNYSFKVHVVGSVESATGYFARCIDALDGKNIIHLIMEPPGYNYTDFYHRHPLLANLYNLYKLSMIPLMFHFHTFVPFFSILALLMPIFSETFSIRAYAQWVDKAIGVLKESSQDISITGFSLGGVVVLDWYNQFHDQSRNVRCVTDRSPNPKHMGHLGAKSRRLVDLSVFVTSALILATIFNSFLNNHMVFLLSTVFTLLFRIPKLRVQLVKFGLSSTDNQVKDPKNQEALSSIHLTCDKTVMPEHAFKVNDPQHHSVLNSGSHHDVLFSSNSGSKPCFNLMPVSKELSAPLKILKSLFPKGG